MCCDCGFERSKKYFVIGRGGVYRVDDGTTTSNYLDAVRYTDLNSVLEVVDKLNAARKPVLEGEYYFESFEVSEPERMWPSEFEYQLIHSSFLDSNYEYFRRRKV